jgi:hypothetical protein
MALILTFSLREKELSLPEGEKDAKRQVRAGLLLEFSILS